MKFRMGVKGFDIEGVVKLYDKKLVLEADLPWAAGLFWGKAESKIREFLDDLFRK